MLYENFYYIIITFHSAGKIWSSICIQDIALHYQINPTRFLHQICLTGKSDENDYLYCLGHKCALRI